MRVGDLYGARLDASLTVLEPDGVALAADPNAPEGEAAATGRAGVSILIAPVLDPSFGNWRTTLGTWRDWEDMGGSVGGPGGPPRLWLTGLLRTGSTLSFEMTDAPPSSTGLLVFGLAALSAPFRGGMMVPTLDVLVPIPIDAQGEFTIDLPITDSMPSGAQLYVQTWFPDSSAPAGWAGTTGLGYSAP